LVSCDDPDKAINDGPWLDPAMRASDCAGIRATYHGLKTAELNAAPESLFNFIFKGTGSDAVMQYLNARVLYIVPANTDFRISSGNESIDLPVESNLIVAFNASTAMWLRKKDLISRFPDLRFWLGQTPIEVNSPSNGFIRLGQSFAQRRMITKMETMVHEARHSDCDSETSDDCGFTHVICPPEHDYKDLPACDNRGIGAYFIGAIYAKTLAESCGNCSEEEKQVAQLVSADAFGRVINLSELKEQKISNPDLKSINTVSGSSWNHSTALAAKVHASRKAEVGRQGQ